ncbi:hypothetical protein RCO28_16510 [Streptomyces sp. LHD-70]|uniref:hypothetical protein n=1 Tax=Streptomyces sp. LHD-70 TaxID=3072140 RepID=UPI0028100D27|nr:hypothetical protein [Streptomyces sp. LHD-70]MDQ8704079.1 hypothetical protein [Streptomyces sp. LHD-70]
MLRLVVEFGCGRARDASTVNLPQVLCPAPGGLGEQVVPGDPDHTSAGVEYERTAGLDVACG